MRRMMRFASARMARRSTALVVRAYQSRSACRSRPSVARCARSAAVLVLALFSLRTRGRATGRTGGGDRGWPRRPLARTLLLEAVLAQHADDHAADVHLVAADDERQHLRVGRLQTNLPAGGTEKLLDRHVTIDLRHHRAPVVRR